MITVHALRSMALEERLTDEYKTAFSEFIPK